MKHRLQQRIGTFVLTVGSFCLSATAQEQPTIAKEAVVDTYHGRALVDPYRNLENLQDPKVQQWMTEQTAYTETILHAIPGRKTLIEKQKELEEHKLATIRYRKITLEDDYFYLKRGARDNRFKLYHRKGYEGTEELLYDPKEYKPTSGNTYQINYHQPSWDGQKIVISLTKNGEEISEMVIMEVPNKTLLPDSITHCFPSDLGGVQWLPDASGFIYSHLPVIDIKSKTFLKNTKSYLYKIGQPKKQLDVFSAVSQPEIGIQPEDFPIVNIKNPKDPYMFGALRGATDYSDTYYTVLQKDPKSDMVWKPLFKKTELIYKFTTQGDDLIYMTAKNASKFKICSTSIINPNFENPKILVAEKSDEVITDFELTKGGIFYTTLRDGVEAKCYHYHNKIDANIPFPNKIGSTVLNAKGKDAREVWIRTWSWTTPGIRYRYDTTTKSLVQENLTPIPAYPEAQDLVVEQHTITSHDGAQVPLSVVYKMGMEKKGTTPVLIRGYGAYGKIMYPYISNDLLLWTSNGGIFAVAHVRGGGEKGEAWHKGGYQQTKPNTWKDLIACTEHLIKEKYTAARHVAINGGSAGGVLIGRAITERPDLFSAAIPEVGVLNMLHFERTNNGANNAKEFGSSKTLAGFEALYEMDAYFHLKKNTKYPATLITAGMNDARVTPWQSSKFAARLQEVHTGDTPVLLHIDTDAGHGIGDSKSKAFEKNADVLSFALWQTGHPEYQPKN